MFRDWICIKGGICTSSLRVSGTTQCWKKCRIRHSDPRSGDLEIRLLAALAKGELRGPDTTPKELHVHGNVNLLFWNFIDIRLVLRSGTTNQQTRRSLPGPWSFRRIVHDHRSIDRHNLFHYIASIKSPRCNVTKLPHGTWPLGISLWDYRPGQILNSHSIKIVLCAHSKLTPCITLIDVRCLRIKGELVKSQTQTS